MYRKILIKSEEDLPKWSKDDKFIVHLAEGKIAYRYGFVDEEYWDDIDWYLIESPISVPTEEEIEKYILTIKRPEKLNTVDYYCTGINAGAKWA